MLNFFLFRSYCTVLYLSHSTITLVPLDARSIERAVLGIFFPFRLYLITVTNNGLSQVHRRAAVSPTPPLTHKCERGGISVFYDNAPPPRHPQHTPSLTNKGWGVFHTSMSTSRTTSPPPHSQVQAGAFFLSCFLFSLTHLHLQPNLIAFGMWPHQHRYQSPPPR